MQNPSCHSAPGHEQLGRIVLPWAVRQLLATRCRSCVPSLAHPATSPLVLLAVQVEMTNVSILLRPNRLCSAALVGQQVQGFAQLLGGSDRLRTSGTTATVVQLNLPVPVTQTSTGTPSKQEGNLAAPSWPQPTRRYFRLCCLASVGAAGTQHAPALCLLQLV